MEMLQHRCNLKTRNDKNDDCKQKNEFTARHTHILLRVEQHPKSHPSQ